MVEDADFDEPAPKATRPGKTTYKAPDVVQGAKDRAAAAEAAHNKPAATRDIKPKDPAPTIEGENMLALLGDTAPIEVLKDEKKRKALYAEIGKAIAAQTVDLSTQAGRDRVKSFAFKITRTRTALDAAGKQATADMREAINAVNKLRNDAVESLQELERVARLPLTEWEEAEAKKAEERGQILKDIAQAIGWANRDNPPLSADECREILETVESVTIEASLWGDDEAMANGRKSEAAALLRAKLEAAELREELARRPPPEPPRAEPVIEHEERPPVIDDTPHDPTPESHEQMASVAGRKGPPAAEGKTAELSPIQKARRLCLPALGELGINGDQAKALILAIEAGEIPGIVATYLEN